MALNFPDSPTVNQIYTDSTSGFSYQWDGTVWKSYSAASTNTIRTLDDISGSFDDVTTIFALTANGDAISPANAQQLLISVGGVMQSPNTDYSVSGSNIIFTTAPQSGLTFFGTLIGTAVPVGVSTVGDVYRQQSYAVTGVQTSFSFPAGYTVGFLEVYRNGVRLISGDDFTATDGSSFDLTTPAQNGDDVEAIGYITASIAVTNGNLTDLLVSNNAKVLGITTLGTNVGAGQTALYVEGNARISGILTVGSSSVTIDGSNNQITIGTGNIIDGSTANEIKVGTGLTVNSSGAIVGIITAATFSGSGSGLTGIVTSVNPVGQTTTSQAGTTTIDLSLGSIIYFNHDTDTTVAFANTATTQQLTFIRSKDNSTTARSITWPSNIYWNGGPDAPELQNEGAPGNSQTFNITTRDGGVSWVGYEVQRNAGIGTYLYIWGYNNKGQLGQNDLGIRSRPFLFENSARWNSIGGGTQLSIATKTDGTLWTWGNNDDGQLGQGNIIPQSSPVQIPGTTWSTIDILGYNNSHNLAIKTDGTLWAWGQGAAGRLGNFETTSRSSPIQIPGTNWSSVSASYFSSATKTDGTLWAWGNNYFGGLGQNDLTNYSSPRQIPGTTWSSIDNSNYYILATKTDGTLWSWGYNNSGNLGQSNLTNYSSPVQIPGTTWSSLSCSGQGHSFALKTDGTLWAWGSNAYGRLGQNNLTQYSSPRQIPGTTWNSVSSMFYGGLATKTDGTLWAWGQNQYSQLGQGDRTQYSSPVQIPGTQWTNAKAVTEHSAAFRTIT